MSETSHRPLILLIDDNADLLRGLSLRLCRSFEVHTATTVAHAKTMAARNNYEAAVVDLCFEGQELDGVHLLDHLNREMPGTFLIVLSGDLSVKRVVEAMRRKLFEFVHKDGDFFESLQGALVRATQISWARKAQATQKFLTRSPATLAVIRMADRILKSGTDAAILLQGESGTGKEVLARYLAKNAEKRFVSASMANISSTMAESILFGHARGAFTDAKTNQIGLIETAHGGIFFLDEIGECSPEVQAKLLRVIQEKEVLPVGATAPRKVQVQFLAATHQNLEEMVLTGRFRRDLLERINTFVLKLPPLRERPQDILLYADLFFDEAAARGSKRLSLSSEAAQALLAHSWPGNVRGLKNVIDRLVAFSNKLVLDAQGIHEAINLGKDLEKIPEAKSRMQASEETLRRAEILGALEERKGNVRKSAKTLGISEPTLYRWIRELGISALVDQFRQKPLAGQEVQS